MAVRAKRPQIFDGVHHVLSAYRRNLTEVVNVNEPIADLAVPLCEVHTARRTVQAVFTNTCRPRLRISLERDDLGESDSTLPSKRTRVKASTAATYEANIRLHVAPYIGHIPLQKLQPEDLDELYVRLLTDGRRNGAGGGLSAKTVRNAHATIQSALSDATRKGTVIRNVADIADPPSIGSSGRKNGPRDDAAASEPTDRLRRVRTDRGRPQNAHKPSDHRPRRTNRGSHSSASTPTDRGSARQRSPGQRQLRLRPRRRDAYSPRLHEPNLRTTHRPKLAPPDPTSRPPPYPCHDHAQRRCASESGKRATRPRQRSIHHDRLPTHPPRHATEAAATSANAVFGQDQSSGR